MLAAGSLFWLHNHLRDEAEERSSCEGVNYIVVQFLSCAQLSAAPWTVAHQAPLSVGFPRLEYWSGLPFPSPEALPEPGIKPTSPVSPALRVDSLPLSHQGSPHYRCHFYQNSLELKLYEQAHSPFQPQVALRELYSPYQTSKFLKGWPEITYSKISIPVF